MRPLHTASVFLLNGLIGKKGPVSATHFNRDFISSSHNHPLPIRLLKIRGGGAGKFDKYSPPSSTFWKPRPTPSSSSYTSSSRSSSASMHTPSYTVQHPHEGGDEHHDEHEHEDEFHEHTPELPTTTTTTAATKEHIQAFLTRNDRNTFIARVYSILAVQLGFTAAVITAFGSNRNLQYWFFKHGQMVPLISVILSSIAWFITCYNPPARRSPQIKWWLLGIFTLGEATLVGFLSSFYKFSAVVSAMLSTAVATGAITLYTLMNTNPKYDLSQWGSNLTSIGLIFIVYGIIHLCEHFGLLPHGFLPYNDKIMGFIGATLFSAYMAYHTRLVVSGKHARYQLNEQDYVFGAMTLYSDVINVFFYILKFLGEDSYSDDH